MALQLKNPGSGSNEYIDVPETRLDTAGIATINSGVLAPAEPINYATPNPVPLPDVTKLNAEVTPPLAPTEPETKAQDLTGRLQALNESLIGESAFKTQQETQQGIPGLLKTHTDLSSQLKAIQNEALAIPLQLQQEATGRGITAAGLAPIQTARLRTNAIQALGVSSLLEASRGNITLAQDLVDRAVAAKYDPIREEIAAKTKNLDLILKSPDFTRAEKNRAQAQLDVQKQKEKVIAKQEADQKEVWGIANTAAKYGADPTTLRSIQQAKTPMDALAIASRFLQDPKAKFELESMRLENILKQEQIATERVKRAEIGQPTTTELKAQKEEIQKNQTAYSAAADTLAIAQDLLGMVNRGEGTSVIGASRNLNFGVALPGTAPAKLYATFDQLKDSLAATNLDKLKGAMSDKDIMFLRNIGTSLRVELGEGDFKRELEKIVNKMNERITKSVFSTDESDVLGRFFEGSDLEAENSTVGFDPSLYYGF